MENPKNDYKFARIVGYYGTIGLAITILAFLITAIIIISFKALVFLAGI